MATTKKGNKTSALHKEKALSGFGRVLGNVEDIVDTVSFRLWEITR